jgi:hypothetical protein
MSTSTPSRLAVSATISAMRRLIVCGVMPCSALYSSCLARRRSVSAIARYIDPVMRSA